LIVGRGNLEAVLRADIARLGLAGKAWLTGPCADMPVGMNALDCLVHPQVGTEALGLVLCEAFACGRPVIASELDGIPEAFAVGHEGRLVPPEDIGALADALRACAQAPRLSEVGRSQLHGRMIEGFSLATSARKILGLYRSLL
jgi:glycosyltransferase involved in cell wall biosynthesis